MRNKLFSTVAIFACIALSVVFAPNTYGQARTSTKTQVISVDALGLFQSGNILTVQYEWKTAPTNSIHIRGRFSSSSAVGGYTGFGIGGGYRFYIADSRALTGLSVAPVVEAWFINHEVYESSSALGIGGEVAYKWIFDQFSVEPGVGIGIGFAIGDANNFNYYTKTRPYVQVHLGYAF